MERPFAVILMDVQMPHMDGYETARLIRMRADCEGTPIIFVTAHTSEEAQIAVAYASGAIDFIFAPIFPDILRAKVTIFIELFLKSRALADSLRKVTNLGRQSRDSEAQIRSVLDNVADGIVTVDTEGMIESFNRSAGTGAGLHRGGGGRAAVLADAGPEAHRGLRQRTSRPRCRSWPRTPAAGAGASARGCARTARPSRWRST